MASVVTKNRALSRRFFLKGFTALTQSRVWIGLPPLAAMFNSPGTAYARYRPAHRNAPPASCSGSTATASRRNTGSRVETGPDYRPDAVPGPAGALPQRHSRHHRPGQSGGASARPRQRSSPLHERADDRHAVHRPRRGRRFHRSGHRQAASRGDYRFRSLQIGVSQESFGESVQRNMSWAGRDRALPPEMLPVQAVRPAVRRARPGLDQPQAQHPRRRRRRCRPRCKQGPRQRRPDPRGRAPLFHSRCGARHRQPAARVPPHRSARSRRRHEGLAAHRQAAKRSAGARAGLRPDPRGVLHVDQVPGSLALPVARLHRRPPSRLHPSRRRSARCRRPQRPAHHARHLPLARRGVRLPGRQAEVDARRRRQPAGPHLLWSTCTSTPKPTSTRTTACP